MYPATGVRRVFGPLQALASLARLAVQGSRPESDELERPSQLKVCGEEHGWRLAPFLRLLLLRAPARAAEAQCQLRQEAGQGLQSAVHAQAVRGKSQFDGKNPAYLEASNEHI